MARSTMTMAGDWYYMLPATGRNRFPAGRLRRLAGRFVVARKAEKTIVTVGRLSLWIGQGRVEVVWGVANLTALRWDFEAARRINKAFRG